MRTSSGRFLSHSESRTPNLTLPQTISSAPLRSAPVRSRGGVEHGRAWGGGKRRRGSGDVAPSPGRRRRGQLSRVWRVGICRFAASRHAGAWTSSGQICGVLREASAVGSTARRSRLEGGVRRRACWAAAPSLSRTRLDGRRLRPGPCVSAAAARSVCSRVYGGSQRV